MLFLLIKIHVNLENKKKWEILAKSSSFIYKEWWNIVLKEKKEKKQK
jgi:hypothetical protein